MDCDTIEKKNQVRLIRLDSGCLLSVCTKQPLRKASDIKIRPSFTHTKIVLLSIAPGQILARKLYFLSPISHLLCVMKQDLVKDMALFSQNS